MQTKSRAPKGSKRIKDTLIWMRYTRIKIITVSKLKRFYSTPSQKRKFNKNAWATTSQFRINVQWKGRIFETENGWANHKPWARTWPSEVWISDWKISIAKQEHGACFVTQQLD